MTKKPPKGFVYIATYRRGKNAREIGVKVGFTGCEEKEVNRRVKGLNTKYDKKIHELRYYYRSKYYKSIEAHVLVCFFGKRDKAITSKAGAKSQEHFRGVPPEKARRVLKRVIGKIDGYRQGEIVLFKQ